MIKKLIFISTLTFIATITVFSQNQQQIDSLIRIASTSAVDTSLAKTYERIARLYLKSQIDSAKVYAQKMIDVSEELGYDKGIALGINLADK